MEIGTHLLVSKNNYYFCVYTRGVYAFSFFLLWCLFLLLYWMFCSLTENVCFSALAFIFVFFRFPRHLCFNEFPLICATSVKRFFLLTSFRMVLSQYMCFDPIINIFIFQLFKYVPFYNFIYETLFRKKLNVGKCVEWQLEFSPSVYEYTQTALLFG